MKNQTFKNKLKTKIIILSLSLILFLSCFVSIFNANVFAYGDNSSSESWDSKDCQYIINFIDKNLNKFVEEYNKTVEDDNYLYASSIEYSSLIHVVEDDNCGAYIDFNGDNGYVVLNGAYGIYDLQVSGDLPELKSEKDITYSKIDGFLYIDNNGNYQKYSETAQLSDNSPFIKENNNPLTSSDADDGRILTSDIDTYVATNYPGYNYVSENRHLRQNFTCIDQSTTSYYKLKLNDSIYRYREGNCALTACYSTLISWQKNGYIKNLPTYTIDLTSDIVNDKNYALYGTGREVTENGITYNWLPNDQYLNRIPKLYSDIYNKAVLICDYTPESGLYFMDSIGIMQSICADHNNSVKINYYSDSFTAVSKYLSFNVACYLSIQGSKTYGSHAVVLLGFRTYEKTTVWWIFKKQHQKIFCEIADNWSTHPVFFDPNVGSKTRVCFPDFDLGI